MAVDPATIAKIVQVVISQLKDEENRKRLLVLIVLPVLLLILVIGSPIAIFFALVGGADGSEEPIAVTMHRLESELMASVEAQKTDADEYIVVFEGSEEGEVIINVQDVLAVFAVRENMGNIVENPDAIARLTPQQVEKLKQIFWDMNIITTSVEEKEIPYDGPPLYDDDGNRLPDPPPTIWRVKTININSLSYTEVIDDYHLSDDQVEVLEELMDAKYAELFIGMLGTGSGGIGGTNISMGGLTPEEIAQIQASLPSDLSQSRQAVVDAANSLVGRVKYFWGGKSTAIGWDSRWGEMREVTAAGSPTTGTTRPFGMDCSGYVQWVFVNAGVPASQAGSVIGSGTATQWAKSTPITKEQLQPGDLVFQAIPGTTKSNHVGICVGFDAQGEPLIAHCSSSRNGVVITGLGKTFKFFRRPAIFS